MIAHVLNGGGEESLLWRVGPDSVNFAFPELFVSERRHWGGGEGGVLSIYCRRVYVFPCWVVTSQPWLYDESTTAM